MKIDDERDVHTEHCCQIHGCKYAYGDVFCTVARSDRPGKSQSFMCEFCDDEIRLNWDLIELLNEMYDRGYRKAWEEANSHIEETYHADRY